MAYVPRGTLYAPQQAATTYKVSFKLKAATANEDMRGKHNDVWALVKQIVTPANVNIQQWTEQKGLITFDLISYSSDVTRAAGLVYNQLNSYGWNFAAGGLNGPQSRQGNPVLLHSYTLQKSVISGNVGFNLQPPTSTYYPQGRPNYGQQR